MIRLSRRNYAIQQSSARIAAGAVAGTLDPRGHVGIFVKRTQLTHRPALRRTMEDGEVEKEPTMEFLSGALAELLGRCSEDDVKTRHFRVARL